MGGYLEVIAIRPEYERHINLVLWFLLVIVSVIMAVPMPVLMPMPMPVAMSISMPIYPTMFISLCLTIRCCGTITVPFAASYW